MRVDLYVYDDKLLSPPIRPRKQPLPVLPACTRNMRHHWRDSLDLKHGISGFYVKDRLALWLNLYGVLVIEKRHVAGVPVEH